MSWWVVLRTGSVPARSRCAELIDPHGPRAGVRSGGRSGVRHGLGRGGWFGRSWTNALRFLGFLQPKQAVSCPENPRVDGSIPSLATTSNVLIFRGFCVSPADHP
jgi:hypothetical protein